ncbi:MAG: biotin-dependent carboxyltransferase family protein [Gammaproteobacteria bacterium]|nr:biotin-dependent carboxyltransferase family protein [Gammaproteobacteria bacterium]
MTKLFEIEKCAPITQYQDLGRFGQLHQGFSRSGAIDGEAFSINNRLLGNDTNATQLEIAPGGLRLRVLADCTIAISGAYLTPTLNGEPLINFCAAQVKEGDVLAFGFVGRRSSGQYAYLAVAGGFSVAPFLDSCSTTRRLSVYPDGELTIGSVLHGNAVVLTKLQGEPRKDLPDYGADVIEVIPAFHYDRFAQSAIQSLENQRFTVSSSDRMGTRLSAEHPIIWSDGELLSEGLIPGAIQIPPDGNPIVLQKDAQSIGGYPKIGVVTKTSLSLLAQKGVNSYIKFQWKKSM